VIIRLCLLVRPLVLLFAVPFSAAFPDEPAAPPDDAIAHVKAAYIYNFTKFVTWPDSAFDDDRAPLVVAVVESREGACTHAIAEEIGGKTTPRGRPIVVRAAESLVAAAGAHLVFVADPPSIEPADLRKAVEGRAVLLVGDTPGFAETVGGIGLVVTGNRIGCEINARQAESASLRLNARLAGVARLVRGSAPN